MIKYVTHEIVESNREFDSLQSIFQEIDVYASKKLINRDFEILEFNNYTCDIRIESFDVGVWIGNHYEIRFYNTLNYRPQLICTKEEWESLKAFFKEKHEQWLESEPERQKKQKEYDQYLALKEKFESK